MPADTRSDDDLMLLARAAVPAAFRRWSPATSSARSASPADCWGGAQTAPPTTWFRTHESAIPSVTCGANGTAASIRCEGGFFWAAATAPMPASPRSTSGKHGHVRPARCCGFQLRDGEVREARRATDVRAGSRRLKRPRFGRFLADRRLGKQRLGCQRRHARR
jgi:hypothetical protein